MSGNMWLVFHQRISPMQDGTVRLWDARSHACNSIIDPWQGVTLANTKSELLKAVDSSYVSCVKFDQSGSWLIAGSGNACLTMWSCQINAIAKQPGLDSCVAQVS